MGGVACLKIWGNLFYTQWKFNLGSADWRAWVPDLQTGVMSESYGSPGATDDRLSLEISRSKRKNSSGWRVVLVYSSEVLPNVVWADENWLQTLSFRRKRWGFCFCRRERGASRCAYAFSSTWLTICFRRETLSGKQNCIASALLSVRESLSPGNRKEPEKSIKVTSNFSNIWFANLADHENAFDSFLALYTCLISTPGSEERFT